MSEPITPIEKSLEGAPGLVHERSRRLVLRSTTSICPRCRRLLNAQLLERGGKVVLSRVCPEHGLFEAVVYGDAERWAEVQRFDKPGDEPVERQTEVAAGCPHDCGICPEHAQHTCLGIIEVNTACNLDCPICFADSGTGPQDHGFSLSLEQVESMLDAFVRAEGEPESVQLSGGEPSIHPEILECWGPPATVASLWSC